MTDTEQDRWGELERLARNSEHKRCDFETAMEDEIKFRRAANPSAILELIAEARGRSVGIANGDEPKNRAEASTGEGEPWDAARECCSDTATQQAFVMGWRSALSSPSKERVEP